MGNRIVARAVFRGYGYTRAQFLASFSTAVYENGEIIWTDDGYLSRANGVAQYQNLETWRLNQSTGYFSVIRATGTSALISQTTNATSNAMVSLINTIQQWNISTSGTNGNISFIDATNSSKTPLEIETNCPSGLLYLDNAGRVEFGGSFGFGSGGRLTATTGTYNNLDVTDTGLLFLNATGGNITLNGMTTAGVPLLFYRAITGGNTLTITHNSGTGNKPILIKDGSKTTTDYAGGFMVYDGSTYWYYGSI